MARTASADDLELFSSLRDRKVPEGCFIGDGIRVVRRMLAALSVERILCPPEWVERIGAPAGIDVCTASIEELSTIVGFNLHQGVMALGRIPAPRPPKGSLFVALDGVSSNENAGAVMRSCAAFGVDGVIIGPGTVSPWNRRSVRTSMGAPIVLATHVVESLVEFCKARVAYAAHIHGERVDFRDVDCRGDVTIVLGSEATGVSDAVIGACKKTIYIPMAPEWDCLNVAASAAVILAEVQRQRRPS